MQETGRRNPHCGAESFGLSDVDTVHWNWTDAALFEEAVRRGEGTVTATGALAVRTGQHTGRSVNDKHIVRDLRNESEIWWDNNRGMEVADFEALLGDMRAFAAGKILFAQDLYGGTHPGHRIKVRVYTEYAWHSLFIRHLLVRPPAEELDDFEPDYTIIDLPSFRADPERHGCRSETAIACDLEGRMVLIGGTSYAGEMKKSVFTILNYLLPRQGIMPMHASANVGADGVSAIFFGLSGTGKTTLSADPSRTLIGDDEHGWGPDGIFNFEGGCYAKTIRLSREAEPQIWAASERFATVLENVVIDPLTRIPDYDDDSLTENTRSAYPIEAIPHASLTGQAGHPHAIIMLTCDAFGVMPPVAKLDSGQAMYHFLSGYTAKVAGTEKGVTEPTATFSTCFGAPFLPLKPARYGALLRRMIETHEVDCWLMNTGWTGGPYGVGKRMPILTTRTLLAAILDGSLTKVETRRDPVFGFAVPVSVPGVDDALLDPRGTWEDTAAYDSKAHGLAAMFMRNFEVFEAHVGPDVLSAAPAVRDAAE